MVASFLYFVIKDREEVSLDNTDVMRVVFPKGDVIADLTGVVALFIPCGEEFDFFGERFCIYFCLTQSICAVSTVLA